ncbi:MAG: hypothetical protein SVO01_04405 [Thermotogota bacterium]|nr:hypothetical protein [Thermotogota bacterium]
MLPMLNNYSARFTFNAMEYLRGEYISSTLKELLQNQSLTEDQIYEMSFAKCKKLLKYAFLYSPYYKKKLRDIDLSKIKTFDDLSKIDSLTKEDLRENVAKIKSLKPAARIVKAKTSGSTGIPLIFPKDTVCRAYHYAAMYRGHSWYGLNIGDREARLWGVPVKTKPRLQVRVKDYFLNRFREKEYNLTEDVLNDFSRKLDIYQPQYIMGYGKMLAEFARFLKGQNRKLEHLRLSMVKYTSENMSDAEKSLAEEVFCCPVVSEYGAAETGIISFQCKEGNHHIMSDCVHVEFLDVVGLTGGAKEVAITDLTNLSFPIIRYRLGDIVVPAKGKCDCGLPFPIIEKIQGRSSEIFSIGGKKFHSIIFYYIMKELPVSNGKLLQFRVVQKSKKAFCYQLACEKHDSQIEEYLVNSTQKELGSDLQVSIEYYKNLPRESSGKLKDFVSYKKA